MGSITDHQNLALPGTGSLADRESAFWNSVRTASRNKFYVEDYYTGLDNLGREVFSSTQPDATAAIQAAINAAGANGGGVVVFQPLSYRVTSTVTVSYDNVLLVCGDESVGSWLFDMLIAPLCHIQMHAPAPVVGPVISFLNFSGARRIYGVGLRGITVDTGIFANGASIGVQIRSVACGSWAFSVNRVQTGRIGFNMICDPLLPATQGDNQENNFEWISIACVATVNSGKCIVGNGFMNTLATGSNTSMNHWGHVACYYSDGGGIDFINADSEQFDHVRLTRIVGSVGIGMIFRKDPTGGESYARHINVAYLQPGAGGVLFEGNAGGQKASTNNRISYYSTGNGSARATWEAGATGSAVYSDGSVERLGTAPLAVGDSVTVVAKTEDVRNNTVALANHPDIKFAAEANAEYQIHLIGPYQAASAASDLSVSFYLPATGGSEIIWSNGPSNAAGNQAFGNTSAVQTTTMQVGTFAANAKGLLHVWAHVKMGTDAGDVGLKWAQWVATVEDSKILKGTAMRVTRVA